MKKGFNKWFLTLSTVAICTYSFAQNNAIFKGGVADGWVSKNLVQTSSNIDKGGSADGYATLNFTQTSNNIFKGGSADGYASLNFLQTSTNLFKGGSGDGWSSTNYAQTSTNVFKGGTSDGWDSKNYVQGNVNILKGGSGDGWSLKNYVQSSLVIVKGGQGDGWASTYRPQGPLPITLMNFDARKLNSSAAYVYWTTSQELNSAYFDVERSTDAINFTSIGQVQAAGNSRMPLQYNFTDFTPVTGMDYYRLRQVDLDGHFVYTPARLVRFDGYAEQMRYYPNPTRGIVNIELSSQTLNEPMVINISTASGVVVDQVKLNAGSNSTIAIDLNRFAKGIYFIQVKTASVNSVGRIILQ